MKYSIDKIKLVLKTYTLLVLVVAAISGLLSMSFFPVLLLAWHIYLWRRPISAFIGFMTCYFLFFAIGLFFIGPVGPYFAWLLALPLVPAIDLSIMDTAKRMKPELSPHRHRVTKISIIVISIALTVLSISLIINNIVLLLCCGTIIVYYSVTIFIVSKNLFRQPIDTGTVQLRIVAGKEGKAEIVLINKFKINGTLFLKSPYDWVKIDPHDFIPIRADRLSIIVSITPTLSGPAVIKLNGYILDTRGLIQTQFELKATDLVVIPRAEYAEWLARKYLAGMNPGILPLISNINQLKPFLGRGIEYYGNRVYQPGDSLKTIDWKHSIKYNELISKEFSDIQTQPVIMLINNLATNAEETDKLAFNIIVTALCLAQDSISTTMAVYDEDKIIIARRSLNARHLVALALQVVRGITIRPPETRYLQPPDISLLQADIKRLTSVDNQPGKILRELLKCEYQYISDSAESHPCTQAIDEITRRTNQQFTFIIISNHSHDGDALAFNSYNLTKKGNSVITI